MCEMPTLTEPQIVAMDCLGSLLESGLRRIEGPIDAQLDGDWKRLRYTGTLTFRDGVHDILYASILHAIYKERGVSVAAHHVLLRWSGGPLDALKRMGFVALRTTPQLIPDAPDAVYEFGERSLLVRMGRGRTILRKGLTPALDWPANIVCDPDGPYEVVCVYHPDGRLLWTGSLQSRQAESWDITKDGWRLFHSLRATCNGGGEWQPKPCTREYDAVQVLWQAEAFDAEHRLSADNIAGRANDTDKNNYAGPLSNLRTNHLVDSKSGRGGGYWLTSKGRSVAERLFEGRKR